MNSYSNDASLIDVSKIDLLVLKERLFNKTELILNTSISEILKNILLDYDSKNSGLIESIQDDLCKKLSTINQSHENNLKILTSNKEKYLDASAFVSSLFDDI